MIGPKVIFDEAPCDGTNDYPFAMRMVYAPSKGTYRYTDELQHYLMMAMCDWCGDQYGSTWTTVQRGNLITLFLFENESHAMGFKLRWYGVRSLNECGVDVTV